MWIMWEQALFFSPDIRYLGFDALFLSDFDTENVQEYQVVAFARWYVLLTSDCFC